MPEKMQALQLCHYGPLRATSRCLQLHEVEKPLPGPGELLIKVHYAGLNPVDYKTRSGLLRVVLPLKLPVTAGNEVAGTVAALGQGTKGFAVGDKVFVRLDKARMGAFAGYVATAAGLVAPVPIDLPLSIAAGVPLVSLTAWQALFEYGQIGQDSKVLIHAGAGAVGRIAIQLARNAGAHVATTVSERGIPIVKALGAHTIINYRREAFESKIRDYDFVLDTVGGDTLKRSFQCVKRGGKVCTLSAIPEARTADDIQAGWSLKLLFSIISWPLRQRAKKHHCDYRFLFMRPDALQLRQIGEAYEQGQLQFDIDKIYELEDYAQAYTDLEQGKAFGKLILKISPD